MKRHPLLSTLGLVLWFALATNGAPAREKKPKTVKEPPAPSNVKLTANLPTFTPLAETNPTQEKGGVRISIAPVAYRVRAVLLPSDRPAHYTFKEGLPGPDLTRNHLVERTVGRR